MIPDDLKGGILYDLTSSGQDNYGPASEYGPYYIPKQYQSVSDNYKRKASDKTLDDLLTQFP